MDWKYLLTSFDGRINRAKFWAAIGVMLVVSVICNALDYFLGLQVAEGIGILGIVWMLISIYLGCAVYAKRWHDRNKSGWWTLIVLVPIIGAFWLLIECGALAGDKGPNRFGADPLG